MAANHSSSLRMAAWIHACMHLIRFTPWPCSNALLTACARLPPSNTVCRRAPCPLPHAPCPVQHHLLKPGNSVTALHSADGQAEERQQKAAGWGWGRCVGVKGQRLTAQLRGKPPQERTHLVCIPEFDSMFQKPRHIEQAEGHCKRWMAACRHLHRHDQHTQFPHRGEAEKQPHAPARHTRSSWITSLLLGTILTIVT